jgi:hypothetical protein
VKHYSFDADLRSVFQRLAATKRATDAAASMRAATSRTGQIPIQPRLLQPRLEIAHVALRESTAKRRDSAP